MSSELRFRLLPERDIEGNHWRIAMLVLAAMIAVVVGISYQAKTSIAPVAINLALSFVPLATSIRIISMTTAARRAEYLVPSPSEAPTGQFVPATRSLQRAVQGGLIWAGIGIGSWGLGNLYWFILELIQSNLHGIPSIYYGYDILFFLLQIGWILFSISLLRYLTPAQRPGRIIYPIAIAALGASALSFALEWYARGGILESPQAYLEISITIVTAIADSELGVLLLLLARSARQNAWPSELRQGLTVAAIGWILWTMIDLAFASALSADNRVLALILCGVVSGLGGARRHDDHHR